MFKFSYVIILAYIYITENGYRYKCDEIFYKKWYDEHIGGKDMEVGLIIVLFLVNVLALDCLYNHHIKTTGALLILNLCLVVALAYQFQQITKIMYVLLGVVIVVLLILGARFYIHKKRQAPIVRREKDHFIEEKEEK